MKKRTVIIAAMMAALCLPGCGAQKAVKQPDEIYQVALLQSLTLGNYDGLISVKELKMHGDIGIGTFEGVNGEMIMLDGKVYQALYDGSVVEASDDETVPYATVEFMDSDIQADVVVRNLDELKEQMNSLVKENGENQFYLIRIDGSCSNIDVRSELKQGKPYRPLDEALAEDQREFNYDSTEGTIVGIYFPAYMSGLNTPGWHFHFVSEDKKTGGHMLGVTDFTGKLQMDQVSSFEMACPNTEDFNAMELGQDQSDRIQSVEQKGN